MEKFLILKLDEETLTHFPERLSDTPLIFDPAVKPEELQQYTQVVLTGSGFDIKTVENFLFPTESVTIRRYLDKLEELEQIRVRQIFGIIDGHFGSGALKKRHDDK